MTVSDFTPKKIETGIIESTFGVLIELEPHYGNPEKAGEHLFGFVLNIAPAGVSALKSLPVLGADVIVVSKPSVVLVGAGGEAAFSYGSSKFGRPLFEMPPFVMGIVSEGKGALTDPILDAASTAAQNIVDELFKVPKAKSLDLQSLRTQYGVNKANL